MVPGHHKFLTSGLRLQMLSIRALLSPEMDRWKEMFKQALKKNKKKTEIPQNHLSRLIDLKDCECAHIQMFWFMQTDPHSVVLWMLLSHAWLTVLSEHNEDTYHTSGVVPDRSRLQPLTAHTHCCYVQLLHDLKPWKLQ